MLQKKLAGYCLLVVLVMGLFACRKANPEIVNPQPQQRKIVYEVTGTHFLVNYIDANSVFVKNQAHDNLFRYEFNKGSGAAIGISIFKENASDSIFTWKIYIDGKLYANAFSEGGAYLTVPYN